MLILASATSAQDEVTPPPSDEVSTEPQNTAPRNVPIIVVGEEANAANVLVGSRIPQRAIFGDEIASSLGTRGLVPQSGMDPAASVRTIKRSECKSDDPAIGKAAACVLIQAKSAIDKNDIPRAVDLLGYLALADNFSQAERLAGAKWQYRLAEERKDDVSRDIALEQMIATSAMPSAEELDARKMLVSLALRDGRRSLARERLEALDQAGGAGARDLANLAILSKEQNAGEPILAMQRAIAAAETDGGAAPQGWRDFVNPPE